MLWRLSSKCRIPYVLVTNCFHQATRWALPNSQRCVREFSSTTRVRLFEPGVDLRPRPQETVLSTVDVKSLLRTVDTIYNQATTAEATHAYINQLADGHPGKLLLTRDGVAAAAWAVAESSDYLSCRSLLQLSHKLGIIPRMNVFEGVVFRLATAGHWHYILDIVSFGKTMLGKTTKRLLNWKIRALIECSEYGLVEQMLHEFQREKLVPDRRSWHLFIQACLLNTNLPLAREYMSAMERAGVPVNGSTHVAVLTAYHMLGQKDDIEARAFETLTGRDPKSDTAVLNSIMLMRMRHGDLDAVCRVFRVFTAPFNIRMTGVELKLVERANQKDPVYRPNVGGNYDHVEWVIISPDARTFGMLIEIFAHQQEVDQIERTFEIMRRCNVRPDSRLVSTLIKAYATVGEHETALARFIELCADTPLVRPFVTAFHIPHQQRVPSRSSLGLSDVKLNSHIYNALLSALLPVSGLPIFQAVLEHMRIMNIEPNQKTSIILIYYLANRGFTPRELMRATKDLAKLPVHCRPNISHVNAILTATLRSRRPLVQKMALRPGQTVTPLNPTPEAESEDYDPSAGLASPANKELNILLDELAHRGLRGNGSTFTLRLWRDAVTRLDMETARTTFRHMKARGIRPNSRHFTILMDGFTRIGDMIAAEEVLKLAQTEENIIPTVGMYTVLIRGYGRIERSDLASQTFFRMMSAGIPPDHQAIAALVDAFIRVKRFFLARSLLKTLWKWVVVFPRRLHKADVWTLRRAFTKITTHKMRPPRADRDRRQLRKNFQSVLLQWKQFYRPRDIDVP
ncbi:hypothetical protein BKA62DRAFT_227715 [Auriculariales sp. MPI-PUGE-AT-0066]|nr:hypothetical protein BKA62DRAFT_227715 [Auriculariales sp. MPI-PUGE-AT-0066]